MTSACEPASSCECCEEPNMGMLIDPKLQFCCFECVADGSAELDIDGEHYRVVLSCGCGNSGPINYDDGERIGYYCGGSQYCIP